MVDPHHVLVHPQAGHDLITVHVGPLGGDEEVDPALPVWNRQAGLGAERGLVLHPHLVVALHDHGPGRILGASPASGPVEHGVPAVGLLRVGERLQHLVLDLDGLHGPAGGLGVVSGDQRHRLAPVLDQLHGEDRLVRGLQAEGIETRDVVADEDGVDAGHGHGRADVEPGDARLRMGTPEGGAEEHAVHVEIARVEVGAVHLRDPIGSGGRLADAIPDGAGPHPGGHRPPTSASRPRRMAP